MWVRLVSVQQKGRPQTEEDGFAPVSGTTERSACVVVLWAGVTRPSSSMSYVKSVSHVAAHLTGVRTSLVENASAALSPQAWALPWAVSASPRFPAAAVCSPVTCSPVLGLGTVSDCRRCLQKRPFPESTQTGFTEAPTRLPLTGVSRGRVDGSRAPAAAGPAAVLASPGALRSPPRHTCWGPRHRGTRQTCPGLRRVPLLRPVTWRRGFARAPSGRLSGLPERRALGSVPSDARPASPGRRL